MPEGAELRDVASEEHRHRPVRDHPELSGEERQLVEVVRARREPAGEAAETDAEDLRHALEPAERGALADHPVGVGAGLAAEILRELARLAESVLARRRVR